MSDNLRNTTPNTPHTNATPPEVMAPAGVIYLGDVWRHGIKYWRLWDGQSIEEIPAFCRAEWLMGEAV